MIKIEKYTSFSADLRQNVRVLSLEEIFSDEEMRHKHGAISCEIALEPEEYHRNQFSYLDDRFAKQNTKEFFSNYCQPGTVTFDAVKLAKFRKAIVTGNGSIITSGGGLLRESIFEWLNFAGTPPNFTRIDGDTLSHAPRSGFSVSDSAAVMKIIPASINYGHWLTEGVSAACILRERILAERCAIALPRAHDMAMREVIYSSLLTVFGSGDRVTAYERDLEDAICFDELYYLTSLHVPLRKSPTGVKAVRQCVGDAAARFGGSANFPTRLYISRTDANTRRLLNERDVIQFLEQRGFTTVSLEELDFLTKVRLFMNADIIIGAKGAGMTNIIFMKPASHAIILSPDDFPDPFHWDQAQHVGIEYCEIFGVSQENPLHGVGFKDFTIEIEQLELAISQICRGEKLIEFH